MTYTLWMHGQQIGQTNFELRAGARQRAGTFHPTELGLRILPSITAMAPALLDLGAMCQREGLDLTSSDPKLGAEILDTFADTSQARRVMDAARHIAAVEVRDASGRIVRWQSLLITDLTRLAGEAREDFVGDSELPSASPRPPARYLVSLTERPAARSSGIAMH